jgi:predicted methyltransferase
MRTRTASKVLPPRLYLCAFLSAAACAHTAPPSAPGPSPEQIVAAPDRSDDDRKLDAGRKPVAMLKFLALAPGMKVADLFAGGGYTTELMARAVAPNGVVYAQNTKMILERFAEAPFSARLAKPVNANAVRVVRELDDPLPPEARELDLVLSNIIYHDAVWLGADRAKMNQAVFAALKPGGRYVVCDSSAKEGSGTSAAESFHRIDEAVVRSEVSAAGFELAGTADFLRNPQDTRDWNSSPRAAGDKRGTSDRFCLSYRKP